jgi:protein-L-isoaspartate(D-aspartate) O-methyltransferase
MRRAVFVAAVVLLLALAIGAFLALRPSERSAPAASDRTAERIEMVERQIAGRGVSAGRVLAAMRAVPRHEFVPKDDVELAYADQPLPIGFGQTISQPYIVALMTELARVRKGDRVLEIGTGSGYQAAVLAELTDHVYSVEIVPELARSARG